VAENPFVEFIARYRDDPVAMVREVLGAEPDEHQQAIMVAVARGDRRISIRSGHRVGKTTTLAWLTVWHALTRFRQKTICTSATSTQLFEALASETKSCFKRLPATLQELFEVQVDQIRLRSAPDDSFVSYVVSKAETPEALAGKHSDYVLIICDEASGIPEPVFEAAVGSMAAHNACTILAGNPIRTSGLFFDTHMTPEVMAKWTTFHISSIGNPRITPDFFEDVESRYGLDSNQYRVRVLGEFPKSEDDVVIPYELLQAALHRDVKATQVRPIWGVDVAYKGADRSSLAKRRGNTLIEKVKAWKDLDTMQLCGVIHNEWKDTPASERPEDICIDSIGFGAGVVDRLREMGLPARGINVAESPALKARFANLKAELWFLAREWFETRDCNIKGDQNLAAELGAVHYKPPSSSGKVALESKDDTKKHTKHSPDLADAFVLTFAGTASSALHGGKLTSSWNQPLKRHIAGIV
jgi:phage terminase large subunit